MLGKRWGSEAGVGKDAREDAKINADWGLVALRLLENTNRH
jgi:hypothetical protein